MAVAGGDEVVDEDEADVEADVVVAGCDADVREGGGADEREAECATALSLAGGYLMIYELSKYYVTEYLTKNGAKNMLIFILWDKILSR